MVLRRRLSAVIVLSRDIRPQASASKIDDRVTDRLKQQQVHHSSQASICKHTQDHRLGHSHLFEKGASVNVTIVLAQNHTDVHKHLAVRVSARLSAGVHG